MSVQSIQNSVTDVLEEVISWRRHLHQNPELSFQEEQTAQFVYEKLHSFKGLIISRPTKTSVMARLIGKQPGKVLAIRADMDALPIQEENLLDFTSTNPGVMHACGHDGHTAMLLGSAKILTGMQEQIKGEVRFLFQHGEELFPGGAQEMVDVGVMDGVDLVMGCHLWANLEVGKIGIVYGPMMASPDTFDITIEGKGGHGAMPHQTIDSIAIGAQVVTNLQHIVSRKINPLDSVVVSVTQFSAGTTHNVIPGSAKIVGTVRNLNPELRSIVPKIMEQIVKGITDAHGANYNFAYDYGYRPVINDSQITKTIEETVKDVLGQEAISMEPPTMGGEDFSAFQTKAPGAFFYVGARNEEKGIIYPHHHPRFSIDEDSLKNGVNIFVNATFNLLNKNLIK
ncbi:M20 family metallopeptidase [Priestia megaterium]|uniref:M20 family metallopeptidase n=1 Tax=Priestia megaterium TaxID=1404 RepID=UPI003671F8A1